MKRIVIWRHICTVADVLQVCYRLKNLRSVSFRRSYPDPVIWHTDTNWCGASNKLFLGHFKNAMTTMRWQANNDRVQSRGNTKLTQSEHQRKIPKCLVSGSRTWSLLINSSPASHWVPYNSGRSIGRSVAGSAHAARPPSRSCSLSSGATITSSSLSVNFLVFVGAGV